MPTNARLNPVSDDAFQARPRLPADGQFSVASGRRRATLNGAPLTVRIGCQSPNPRLAATVRTIARSTAAAGITVVDATSTTGPQTLRDGQLTLLASTGGATGSGSTGTSAMDGYALPHR